jgi:hypothetical protein
MSRGFVVDRERHLSVTSGIQAIDAANEGKIESKSIKYIRSSEADTTHPIIK